MALAAIATFTPAPANAERFTAAFGEIAAAVRQEPGNRFCQLFRSRDQPGQFIAIEIYDDDAALAAHAATPHAQSAAHRLMPLLEAAPSVLFCDQPC